MGDTIKLGLIGCGGDGRGTGAVFNAMTADRAARLVALGDVCAEKAETAHRTLREVTDNGIGERVARDGEMKRFGGFDAYKGVVEHCDVVIVATPPHFHPAHVRAAVDAGRHVFVEPPAAVDVPGLKRMIETVKLAKEKKLSFVAGFPSRYNPAAVEVVRRVREERAIGDIVTTSVDYLSGGRWMNPRQPEWDDMTWQLRNWRYFCWLSGDFITCDAITSLDNMLWLMGDAPPMKVSAAGGRSQRTGPAYGNIYDHFSAMLEWPGGQRGNVACRQWTGEADQRFADVAIGTLGTAALRDSDLRSPAITGANAFTSPRDWGNGYELEQKALLDSVRTGKPINDGERLMRATAVALMIRSSAYTGKTVFWDRASAEASKAPADAPVIWESTQDFSLAKYELGPMPVAPVAVPGETKFV
jgi:predicted dehydrogenase